MPQNEDDYETDGEKKNVFNTQENRVENVVRDMLLLLFSSSQSENEQIIVLTKFIFELFPFYF
jgi:hypothetical protein